MFVSAASTISSSRKSPAQVRTLKIRLRLTRKPATLRVDKPQRRNTVLVSVHPDWDAAYHEEGKTGHWIVVELAPRQVNPETVDAPRLSRFRRERKLLK